MFWAGIAFFGIGAAVQLIVNGAESPWFWGPLIPFAALLAWRAKQTR